MHHHAQLLKRMSSWHNVFKKKSTGPVKLHDLSQNHLSPSASVQVNSGVAVWRDSATDNSYAFHNTRFIAACEVLPLNSFARQHQ
jgi:hypothetical protein